MGDLISRTAAVSIPVLPKEYREYQTMNLDDAYELGWYDLQKCIEKMPSVEPEIIRCKNCKHWYKDADSGMSCEYTELSQPEDGFCNWAERKEE